MQSFRTGICCCKVTAVASASTTRHHDAAELCSPDRRIYDRDNKTVKVGDVVLINLRRKRSAKRRQRQPTH
jgi:hypothetical protein